MPREIRFNAFEMNCVVHQSPGLWRAAGDRSRDYKTLEYWVELARTLERGLFDGLFLADVLGVYDVYGAGPEAALQHAIQVPANDPSLLVPAMAYVTENLGFGVTVNLSYEPPFTLARRFSTLDHLTSGRIGWNVVTGYLDSAARANGLDRQTPHDTRYEIAEEYMQLVYRLWEDSWDDDAVTADAATGVYADPAKVRAIRHDGPHFKLNAVHLCEPSPQRTPVIYQAGTSPAGRVFAARHAECVFISGPSKEIIRSRAAALREERRRQGHGAAPLLIFALATIITGETDEEAAAKHAAYLAQSDPVGALTLMSGWTGVDFSGMREDEIVSHVVNDAGRTALENVTRADPARRWTVGEVARHVSVGGIGPVFVGGPSKLGDLLEEWVDETGIDGFNLAFAGRPETFASIADVIVPELQRRGRYKTSYAPGTLRQKLFGSARRPAPRGVKVQPSC